MTVAKGETIANQPPRTTHTNKNVSAREVHSLHLPRGYIPSRNCLFYKRGPVPQTKYSSCMSCVPPRSLTFSQTFRRRNITRTTPNHGNSQSVRNKSTTTGCPSLLLPTCSKKSRDPKYTNLPSFRSVFRPLVHAKSTPPTFRDHLYVVRIGRLLILQKAPSSYE